ncbi:MAG TPA: hypothetical protein PLA71_00770 [Saccharofermentans sp.]|nr:hypothetical protein [Saccharofermentans sp.]
MDKIIYERIEKLFVQLDTRNLNESELTYYELRRFLAYLISSKPSQALQDVLVELIKLITMLEIKGKPVPLLRKNVASSPQVFGGAK